MKKINAVFNAMLAAWLLTGFVGLADGEKKTDKEKVPDPAEKDGWTLVFSDDFKRNELGKDWVVVNGDWKVENGYLRGSGLLISARGFPGDYPSGYQRLEFEAATDVQPIIFFKDKPKPKVSVGDISSLIHAQPPEKEKNTLRTGYFFQFGGFLNTQNQLRRNGSKLQVDAEPKKLITPDKVHKVILENDKGKVRCFVDGELVLEDTDKQAVVGTDYDRVGFYFYTAAKVFNVKVYVKHLPNDLDLD